jgi:glycerophosphoryl diester phosphodiesterase
MLHTLTKPVILAHRGASGGAPENTLAAFELAREQGADGIELDVKLSADGVPVVFHDPLLDRTTNGHGTLADFDLVSLQKLDAGDGQRIPTLAQVFERVGRDLFINIELTNYTTSKDDLVDKVAALVKEYQLQSHVLFSSFLPKNLKLAAELLPDVPRGLLAIPRPLGIFARAFGFRSPRYQAIHPHHSNTSQRVVAQAHSRGQRVHVWTVNDAVLMRKLAGWGVDGIITDDPQLAVKVLRNY